MTIVPRTIRGSKFMDEIHPIPLFSTVWRTRTWYNYVLHTYNLFLTFLMIHAHLLNWKASIVMYHMSYKGTRYIRTSSAIVLQCSEYIPPSDSMLIQHNSSYSSTRYAVQVQQVPFLKNGRTSTGIPDGTKYVLSQGFATIDCITIYCNILLTIYCIG